MKRVTLTVALALSAIACESGARDSAVEDFADKYTCREAWVQARIRNDVSPRVFRKRPEPPAEVKKDPQRVCLPRNLALDGLLRYRPLREQERRGAKRGA